MTDSLDSVGNVADPQSSQTLGSGASMVDATQSLATGPAAGPTASQTFGSGASQDYDKTETGPESSPAESAPQTSAPIPTETDDGGAAAGDISFSSQATIANPQAGAYSTSGDAEIKGQTRTDPTETGNS